MSTVKLDPGAAPEQDEAEPGRWARFWRRYSPYGELPLSSGASIAVHIFVILLGMLGVASLAGRTERPPGVSSVIIGDDGGSAPGFGADGLPTGDGSLEDGLARGEQGSGDVGAEVNPALAPPTGPAETVRGVSEDERTVSESALTSDQTNDAIRTTVGGAGQRAADSLAKAKSRLANNMAGGGRSGGAGAGGQGGGTGQGGGGGNAPKGRAARPSRWVLRFNTSSTKDYLEQFEGLKATIAFAGKGDEWIFFPKPSSNPSLRETRDLAGENRLYWVDENPQNVRGVAGALGVGSASAMIAFLPIEVENKMLRLELAYRGLEEEDIASTTFAVTARGGGYDVEVIQQIPK